MTRSQGPKEPRSRGTVGPRARPSASADTTVQAKVRFHVDQIYEQQELLLKLGRRRKLKPIDRAEVDRALWRLLLSDRALQERVLDELA